jgi:hypothetical protein
MSRVSALLAAVVVVASVGCSQGSYTRRERLIWPGAKGPEQSKITNYLTEKSTGSPERVQGALSRAVITDEAWIRRFDQRLCFDLIVRNNTGLDAPLTDYNFSVNGHPVYVGEEMISVHDYTVDGERDVFAAQGLTATAFASLRVTEPTTETFRVIERHAVVCAPRLPMKGRPIMLSMVLPRPGGGMWGAEYVWRMQ